MITRKVTRGNKSSPTLKINLPEEIKWEFGDTVTFEIINNDEVKLRRLK